MLLRLAEDQHILLLSTHHIVFDGWSELILLEELAAHYRALATGAARLLPELAIQYGDYAQWQRQRLQGPLRAPLLHYWKQQLAHIQVLELPVDRPHPAAFTHVGARESRALPGN